MKGTGVYILLLIYDIIDPVFGQTSPIKQNHTVTDNKVLVNETTTIIPQAMTSITPEIKSTTPSKSFQTTERRTIKPMPLCPIPCECTPTTLEVNAWEVNCQGKQKTDIPSIGIKGQVFALDLSRNRLTSIPSNAFNGVRGVRILTLSGNTITYIDSDAFVVFYKTLNDLDLSNNKLTTMLSSTRKLQSLLKLNLNYNGITHLRKTDLQSFPHLEELQFVGNHLTSLSGSLAYVKNSLTMLYLDNNRLDNSIFKSTQALNQLKLLSISQNNIKTVAGGRLGKLTDTLQTFVLNNTNLGEMPHLSKFKMLRELDLKGNRIRNFDFPATGSLKSTLQILLLDDMGMTKIPESVGSLSGLHTLSLKDNKIIEMPFMANKLQKLQYLNLVDNAFNNIPVGFLKEHPKLIKLDMKDNNITNIPPLAFVNSWSLQFLYIARNNIKTIAPNALLGLEQSIQILGLNRNKITVLDYCVFSRLKKLTRLSIVGNPLLCECEILWLRKSPFRVKDTSCAGPGSFINSTVLRFSPKHCPPGLIQQTKPICLTPEMTEYHTTPQASIQDNDAPSKFSGGAVAGIVLGIVSVAAVVVVLICLMFKINRDRARNLWGRMI